MADGLCNQHNVKATAEGLGSPGLPKQGKGRVTVVDKRVTPAEIPTELSHGIDKSRDPTLSWIDTRKQFHTLKLSGAVVESQSQPLYLEKLEALRLDLDKVIGQLARLERLLLEGDSDDEGSDFDISSND